MCYPTGVCCDRPEVIEVAEKTAKEAVREMLSAEIAAKKAELKSTGVVCIDLTALFAKKAGA